ncbi:MAG: putative manganese transporter [Kiritimatiellia bacterium]|jgi:hypothetical protein
MHSFSEIIEHALMITGFVGVIMLIIEYVNVVTTGRWLESIRGHRWGQYLAAAILGVMPGCLGSFVVVAMYTHRTLSLGALMTTMIATAGDASFLMFAMIPRTAFILHGILFALGIVFGILTDALLGNRLTNRMLCPVDFTIHNDVHDACLPHGQFFKQWQHCSATRGTLTISLGLFLAAILLGRIGPSEWNWVRWSLAAVSAAALFVVATVSDHFLEEHLWKHVVRSHVPRIFMWTLGAMLLLSLAEGYWNLGSVIEKNRWIAMGAASLAGIIPDSGPHLIFITMFAEGMAPFSLLLANSIVQDGHGMLPLLAHSRRAFIFVKLIKLAIGLMIGALFMWRGY